MYVKRALIAALEPQFYRDGLLQHTRAVTALVSHYGRPLQHRAAAWPRAASFIHTAVDRCSTGDSHPSAPLQQTAAAHQFVLFFLTPAYRCGRLLQRTRAGAAVDGCSILSSGHRCSKLLQHAWLSAGWLAERWLASWLIKHYSHMLRSSAAARAKTPGWPQGRGSSQAVVSSFQTCSGLALQHS